MSVVHKLTEGLPVVPALFPAADTVIRAVPVPADYALQIKLPTALLCLIIVFFLKRPRSKKLAIRFTLLGVACMVVYLVLAALLLQHNPNFHQAGDNSTVGLWLTEVGQKELKEKGGDIEALHRDYGPEEWVTIYSKPSQLCSVAVLTIFYVGSFVTLTYGFARVPKRDGPG